MFSCHSSNSCPVYSTTVIIFLTVLFIAGCNSSSDQREFERSAFSIPEGITETNNQGGVIRRDPDDWRVAPFFQGIIEIEPAYPNPVLSTDQVRINRIVTGVESISGLRVFVFYETGNVRPIEEDPRRPLPPGLDVIILDPQLIAEFPENPQGLYRIVITDLNENVITYGDIRVD
jgi:hypothetical protein